MTTDEQKYDEECRKQDQKNAVKAVRTEFSRVVLNTLDDGPMEEFVTQMASEHRTLQQNFTRLAVQWLNHLATLPESRYDGRNEASVQLARKLVGNLSPYDLSLPTI